MYRFVHTSIFESVGLVVFIVIFVFHADIRVLELIFWYSSKCNLSVEITKSQWRERSLVHMRTTIRVVG